MNNEDISGIIGKIMQNPEFSKIVRSMRDGQNTDGGADTEDIMSKLPEVMSVLSPLISSGGESKTVSDGAGKKEERAIDKITEKYDRARTEKLLRSLKPYLNKERCEIIDKCMSVMQLGDVMDSLGGLEGLIGTKGEKEG